MDKHSETDNKFLIRKLSVGDKDAFNFIFSTYYPGLVIFANEFVQDKDSAEDIVQGFFVKFWTDRGNIQIESSLKSYLLKSVQNKCLDFLKHRKIKDKYYEKIQKEMRNEIDYSEKIMLTYELKEKIEISINSLPGSCKEIFIMSRYENKKYKEIADTLGISVKTVEAKIGKALKLLHELLKDYL